MRSMQIIIAAMLFVGAAGATVKEIKREKEFYCSVKRADFATVLLYDKNSPDCAWQQKMMQVRQQFAQASASQFYKQAGMKFFAIDVSRNDLRNISRNYGINSFPAFLLFGQGAVVRNNNNQPVAKGGYLNAKGIKKFVDNELLADLEDVIREKNRREAEFWDRYPSAYFSYGFAFPGYADFYAAPSPRQFYDYPYYYGPSVGFGVTVPIR
jgi:hypothetical protein